MTNFDKHKKCIACNKDYIGTASSKYCLDCRYLSMEATRKREPIVAYILKSRNIKS